MTTIAFDGCTFAADTKSVDTHGLIDTVPKIFHVKNLLVAGAGMYGEILTWVDWVRSEDGDILTQKQPHLKRCSCMVVNKLDGKCYRLCGERLVLCERRFHAIGSGRDYALMAMHLGKSAWEAVVLASQFDNDTNDIVVAENLLAQA